MEEQVDAGWRSSSYSGNGGGNCVEVGRADGAVLVRDSKNRDRLALSVPAAAWRAFADTVKRSST